MLEKLLNSFSALTIPSNTQVYFLIVENDTCQQVKKIVINKNQDSFIYAWEPKIGIPIARNRCVEMAVAMGASHIAFVDDDEWLPSDWLEKMWGYYLAQDKNTVVQGPVVPVFPDDTPDYFKPFFQPKAKSTGEKLHMCATNNVLVPVEVFNKHNLRFDESRPLAGGTDSKLFRQARSMGIPLIYFEDAFVYETVPTERISYAWLSRRHFRIGLTIGEHAVFKGRVQLFSYCTRKLMRATIKGGKSVSHYVMGNQSKHLKSWLKACRALGEMLGPLGVAIDSYDKVQGS